MKILQAGNFEVFRQFFRARLGHCFCVPADTFDNVNGQFAIGFFVWDTSKDIVFTKTKIDVYDASGHFILHKNIVAEDNNKKRINAWITKTSMSSIGVLVGDAPDYQNNKSVCITNEKSAGHKIFTDIGADNLFQCAIYLVARLCIPATWLNNRDQFLYPNGSCKSDEEFHTDCLTYTIFHRKNYVRTETGMVNNWIPFTEEEVNAKDTFKSHFMTNFLQGKLSVPKDKETLPGFGMDYAPPQNESSCRLKQRLYLRQDVNFGSTITHSQMQIPMHRITTSVFTSRELHQTRMAS